MNSWKIVGDIATVFGVAFIVFAVFQAVLTYEDLSIRYSGTIVPNGFFQESILTAMLPLLLFAVLSFLVAGVTLRAVKETEPETADKPEAQPEMAPAQAEQPTSS